MPNALPKGVFGVLGISLTACLVILSGCQHSPTEVAIVPEPTRSPASFSDTVARENSFLATIAIDAEPATFRASYLDRLLEIYYRSELYLEEFEDHIERSLKKQKYNPEYRENVLDNDIYAKELKMRSLADQALGDIEYIYQRLLETSRDSKSTDTAREHSVSLIADIHEWLSVRPAEDKLMLASLYEHLSEIKKNFDKTAAANKSADKKNSRMVAAKGYDFDPEFFAPRDLTSVYEQHKSDIRLKALDSVKWHDTEADSPAIIPVTTERSPSSVADAGFTPLHPDPGGDGTMTGAMYPEGQLTFTFDDGPLVANDQRLIGFLTSHRDRINASGLPANFFWLVNSEKVYPGSIPLAKAAGISMNNHSWSHPDLMTQTQEQLNHEINDSNSVLLSAFGRQPMLGGSNFRFFRCPYGSCLVPQSSAPDILARAANIRRMIANLKLINVYWTIDSRDWALPHQQQRIFDLTVKQIQLSKRGIILMHDIHSWTVDTAKMLFDWIQDSNDNHGGKWRVVNLETAMDEFNKLAAASAARAAPTPVPTPAASPASTER